MDSLVKWLSVGGVPLALLLAGMLARRLGRRDGDATPCWNDWALSTAILLMLLGIVLADLRLTGARAIELSFWLVGVLTMIFMSLNNDRYSSWNRTSGVVDGTPTQKHWFWGVIFPDSVGLTVFVLYQARKVGLI
jgi:hypothetical protein